MPAENAKNLCCSVAKTGRMSEKVPMTPGGQARLREEMRRLKEVDLPQVVKDIGIAREHGDLKENAEYHAAKDRQGMIVARISYVEQALARAEVIDPTKLSGSKVQFGARVKLVNLDNDEEQTFQIVGPEEADIKQGRISVASPLARGLLGHEVGDEVKVQMPAGPRTFEILEITFARGEAREAGFEVVNGRGGARGQLGSLPPAAPRPRTAGQGAPVRTRGAGPGRRAGRATVSAKPSARAAHFGCRSSASRTRTSPWCSSRSSRSKASGSRTSDSSPGPSSSASRGTRSCRSR